MIIDFPKVRVNGSLRVESVCITHVLFLSISQAESSAPSITAWLTLYISFFVSLASVPPFPPPEHPISIPTNACTPSCHFALPLRLSRVLLTSMEPYNLSPIFFQLSKLVWARPEIDLPKEVVEHAATAPFSGIELYRHPGGPTMQMPPPSKMMRGPMGGGSGSEGGLVGNTLQLHQRQQQQLHLQQEPPWRGIGPPGFLFEIESQVCIHEGHVPSPKKRVKAEQKSTVFFLCFVFSILHDRRCTGIKLCISACCTSTRIVPGLTESCARTFRMYHLAM